MTMLQKLMYIFNTIPIKIQAASFAAIDKQILNFIWMYKGLRLAPKMS